jgi:hypothetical protein
LAFQDLVKIHEEEGGKESWQWNVVEDSGMAGRLKCINGQDVLSNDVGNIVASYVLSVSLCSWVSVTEWPQGVGRARGFHDLSILATFCSAANLSRGTVGVGVGVDDDERAVRKECNYMYAA